MAIHHAVLLAFLFFLAEFNAVSARIYLNESIKAKADANVLIVQRTLIESKNMSSSKLLLRSYKSGDGSYNLEDRVDTQGLSSKISGLVSKLFSSSSSQERTIKRIKKGQSAFTDLDLYSILRKTTSREELVKVFQSLEDVPDLKTLAISIQKSMSGKTNIENFQGYVNPDVFFDMLQLSAFGGKLDGSPLFTQWLKYVSKYRENRYYDDYQMLDLFRKVMPEESVVALLHSLRQVPGMKNQADTMLRGLFFESKTSHKVINDVWLDAKVSPEEVFKILQLKEASMTVFDDNAMLFQWIRYFEGYRKSFMKTENLSIFDEKLRMILQKNNEAMNNGDFAALFQVIKEAPQLKRIGTSMQASLFKELLTRRYDPSSFSSLLSIPYAFRLKEDDPIFRTLKAFTLQFAKERGGKTAFTKVKTLFNDGTPNAALAAAGELV
ncbi:RxLR effector protein [Phytophthora megakarya]|uniref:RxLR effector protein n=1 Tax=Phytophthora megakarya TaxID=4795 RepID=A0A225VSB8_9STRA|nr:RxLR effector protein [Phytophthora megakarya]